MPIMTAADVQTEATRLAGRGIQAAARMYANLVKQVLSVPAPRRRAITGQRSKTPGVVHYVATTAAVSGAPPRKLSGRLRASIAMEFDAPTNTARIGTSLVYGRRHEEGDHAYLLPTLKGNLAALEQIVGQSLGAA